MPLALKTKITKYLAVGFVLVVLFSTVAGVYFLLRSRRTQVVSAAARLSKNLFPSESVREISLQLGWQLAKAKEYKAALKVFEEVLLSEPTNVSVLNNLAYVAAETGDLRLAAEYLQTALQISDKCAECLNNLGSVLLKQGKAAEARPNFEQAIQIDPAAIDPKLNLAVLFEGQSDWASALEWYRMVEPQLQDAELKKWVNLRIIWMAEISPTGMRKIASEK